MPKVTVIMPCLNMEKYIRECVESVLFQTLRDIEVLIIDAGSTDGTIEIIKEYSAKDNRVCLIHSEKKSYGYQVNMGISLARGEYVGIVDTDDFIAPDMYENLYNTAKKFELDYCKGLAESFVDILDTERLTIPIRIFDQKEDLMNKVINPAKMPDLLIKDCYLWNGIYRIDFIKTIKLNETSGAAYQDLGFIFQVYSMAEKAMYMDKVIYYYRKDNMNSSGYNRKAFSYLVKEYTYLERLLDKKDQKWVAVVYEKMLLHCHYHISSMAFIGEYWEEALSDIDILKEKLKNAKSKGLLKERESSILEEKYQLFMLDFSECYNYYKGEIEKKKDAINSILREIRGKDVIIFGSGNLGKFVHAMIIYDGHGDNVLAYCDNCVEEQGKRILDKKVLSPENAALIYPEAYFLIASKYRAEEMKDQLIHYGILAHRIFVYTAGSDNFGFYKYLVK